MLGFNGLLMVDDGTRCGNNKACYEGDCKSLSYVKQQMVGEWHTITLQGGPKNWHNFWYALTLPNINGFSVATHLRYDGFFGDSIITNFLLILMVK